MRHGRLLNNKFFTLLFSAATFFSFSQTTVNFTSCNTTNWTVPPCVTSISITMSGAQGGGTNGGTGAVLTGNLTVTPGQVLQITVGCQPNGVSGGNGGGGNGQNASGGGNSSYGGGGATSISIGGSPVAVAGGGGGMGGGDTDAQGGDAGCPNGMNGTSPFGQGGYGASTSSGGAGGPPWISSGNPGTSGSSMQGGNGGSDPCYNLGPGGGGGGGYYGGGGGGSDCFGSSPLGGGGGGGGSSLVPGGMSCSTGHTGNGSVSITYIAGTTTATATNTGPYCVGQTIQLNSTGTSPFSWSGPGGYTSSSQNPTRPGATVAMSGVYTVTVGSGGCTATATTNVIVNPSPTVTVNSATVCTGGSATLTASGATSYSWTPGGGTGSTIVVSPGSTTVYTVTGTTGSCTSTATATVTISPFPAITVNSATVCAGNSATLTATGASTYTWSPSGSLSSSTGSSVVASPGSTTAYTITGTSAGGCTATATATVTVAGAVTPSVNSATICSGNSTTLNATGASTYSWSPGTGLNTTSGPSVIANPTSTTTYTITGSSGTCTGTTTAVVTVNPTPTITASPATICAGASATLTATGATSYNWSPSSGLNTTTGSSVVANPGTTTTYTVIGTVGTCTGSATSLVTVNPLPTVSVNNGIICNGGSTTLNASGASSYNWSPGTGLSSTTGSSVTANPSSTTQYTVTGTDANGCVDSDTTTVTVVNNPTVTVTTATICTGSSATLTANGAVTFAWSPGTGLNTTSGSSVIANPGSTIVYTVTGSAGTCTAVATTTVTVNPLPVVTAGSNSPLCVNQNLNLTSSGGVSYSWSGPSNFSSSQQNPSINGVTTSNGGVYTVTATDANGCVNAMTTSVTVNPLPIVTASGATVCLGATINLASTGGVTYSWAGPNAYSSNQQNPSIPNATQAMAGSYVVTVTDANGCSSGNAASVVVNPSLIISASSNSPVCQNGTLNLTASSGVSWMWSGPNSYSSFAQNPSISPVTLAANGTYTVVGTDMNGCQGTATTQVTINALPTVTANTATICVTQQAATLTASGASTYVWTPAATLSGSAGTTVTGTPLATTVYTVTGTDANGCVNSGTTAITVNPLPTVTVNSATICIGNSTSLTANGALNYVWSPAAGLSSTSGSSVTANPTSTSSYSITGTDANGCYSSTTCSVLVNPLPAITVNSGSICAGKNMTLNALGANTYVWTPTTGLNTSTGASVIASPANTTTYVVTGTDVNGCVNTDTTSVTVNPLPVLSVAPANSSGCAPVCVSLTNTTTATGTCSWNFGDGGTSNACATSHCYTVQGTYSPMLTLTDANGCVNTATASVAVYPVPDANFSFDPQPTTTLDPLIHFYDGSTGAVIAGWNWTFGDAQNSTSTSQNPTFNYGDAGSYSASLLVTSDQGCTDSVTQTVVIEQDFMLYVPNAFTPNSDGINDIFTAKGEGIIDFKMYIFDRWGNMVFFSDTIEKGWDGRMLSKGEEILQQDTYAWKIILRTFKKEPRQLSGVVSLIK